MLINIKIINCPIFFFGTSILIRYDSFMLIKSLLYNFSNISIENKFFENINFISTNLGLLCGFEFNLFRNKLNFKNNFKLLYLINADICDYHKNYFIIYQGFFINSSFIFSKQFHFRRSNRN